VTSPPAVELGSSAYSFFRCAVTGCAVYFIFFAIDSFQFVSKKKRKKVVRTALAFMPLMGTNPETPREPICGFWITSVGCRRQENASCHSKEMVQFGK
jgi:hypothetical protein